jgi:PPE-repeat protein
MSWFAFPPEVNTALLMAGAGSGPMLKASAGWEAMGVDLERQADELGSAMASLKSAWQGPASERAIASYQRMVTWLQYAAQHAHENSRKAAAQAAAHAEALGSTPSLPEIASNHITTAVLAATNFFGINTMPIGACEMDYFGRMWTQAGSAMDIYQAQTALNTTFGNLEPPQPIVQSEVGQTAAAEIVQHVVRGTPQTQVSGMAALTNATAGGDSTTGDGSTTEDNSPADVGGSVRGDVHPALAATATSKQSMSPWVSKLFAQGGAAGMNTTSTVVDDTASLVDGDAAALASGDIALLGGADGNESEQIGLLGASPISTHPMAGGSGPSVGMGLMYSEALPGSGGSAARTSAMAGLIDKPAQGLASAANGAGSSASGGAAPMGMMGAGASSGAGVGARPSEMTSAVLTYSDDDSMFDDGDDW